MRDKNKQPLQSRDSPQRASRRDFLKESSKMLGAGLAFSTLGAINPIFAATQAKKQNPREIELILLKNRFGLAGESIFYEFFPAYNLYKEIEETNTNLFNQG